MHVTYAGISDECRTERMRVCVSERAGTHATPPPPPPFFGLVLFLCHTRLSAIIIKCSAGVHNMLSLLTVNRAPMANGEGERGTTVENMIL